MAVLILLLLAIFGAAPSCAQSREAATPLPATASAAAEVNPSSASQPADKTSDSTLGLDTGDLLDVRVFDTPELSGKLRVDEAGQITLPIGGAVTVRGLTAEQVGVAIEERLRQRNILRDPHVDVFVDDYATQGVTVAGEVKTPGIYPWSGKHTVLDFISAAGGVTPYASRTVTLSRKDREQVITFQMNNSMQMPGGADLEARPGDRILVTRAGVVYVVGDVGRSGRIPHRQQRHRDCVESARFGARDE